MNWTHSRRLRYLAGVAAVLFTLFIALRLVFLLGFSGVPLQEILSHNDILFTTGIGLRFDLRLALLVTAPLALLAWAPKINLVSNSTTIKMSNVYLALAVSLVLLVYIIDFGHYAYLGVRINATVLRYFEDSKTASEMVWQTYPVVWICLGWLCAIMATLAAVKWVERRTLRSPSIPISKGAIAFGTAIVFSVTLLGLVGRLENLNIKNPVPLRWSDAFYTGNAQIAATGLNPVLFLYDTLRVDRVSYDEEEARRHYPAIANYLGVTKPDPIALNYQREHSAHPSVFTTHKTPNVVFVMLESLGTSAVGAYGNPLNPTPNLDRIASQGLFFRHFYVPVTGTAKTVWASITGVPDVTREQTATRNPLISKQHSLLNALEGYEKYYMIGGNAGWANINAVVQQSVDGIQLYDEPDWRSPRIDVWGISDLNFFKESTAILGAHRDDQPFFAFLQTSGNHRPFTIPKENDGFEPLDLPLEVVQHAGSRSVAQFNAVRLLDFNIGKLLEMAENQGFLKNTIFVFFGDHNTRISQIPHMAPAFEQLGLESNNVPMIIYAPGLIEPGNVDEATGLVDLLPTVLGMLGKPYMNNGMGRDLMQPAPEGERVVPLVLQEGTFPVIGGVTKRFLLQMQHDGSSPTLHDLYSPTPLDNVAGQHPEAFSRLTELTRAMHETSRVMLYRNVRL
ncbi:alkaline phosphatase family protein [Pseudomonas sp. S60]|uniref:LTA synthase family protein n=1 Tax=Pseudomonas sp. S60 TaxID=211124 RepID=UPI001913E343|nr:LTA synthase family protein [Pseudomonas sp. S60]MBK5009193.1 alkaline phosphatase family protein [Pseudomonas sp. S60]